MDSKLFSFDIVASNAVYGPVMILTFVRGVYVDDLLGHVLYYH